MPDRNGKIFYTSITSLSHIRKCGGVRNTHFPKNWILHHPQGPSLKKFALTSKIKLFCASFL
ncbi:hypothetical protein B5F52_16310 [Flavonifractor plautii]|uniref:Uncharacterized protein n=1 Tax=Flavonifractor plautii ATCC 29863 TaxID=411475 RepID=G9YNQ7_FLAPL|nr:hypothetical protein HMPREF0372_01134 [Flavonifractor plautii ATCC 29863]OUO78947.1 hypothetical protein B5F52_16310 [Flavonifractor plautii]